MRIAALTLALLFALSALVPGGPQTATAATGAAPAAVPGAAAAALAVAASAGDGTVTVDRRDYLTLYRLPGPRRGPWGIAVSDPGSIWVTATETRSLGRLDPADGSYREFPLPAGAIPFLLTFDGQGRIWTTAYDWTPKPENEGIFRFDPATGQFASLPLPTAPAGPARIVMSRSGDHLWFTEFLTGKLGRIQDGKVTEVPIAPAADGGRIPGLVGLAEDDHGRIWIAVSYRDRLARYDPRTGGIENFTLPDGFWGPTDVVVGNSGLVYVGSHGGNRIAALDSVTGRVVAEYETFPPSDRPKGGAPTRPLGMVTGSKQEIWVAEHEGNRIARILPTTRSLVEYQLPGQNVWPQWITRDAGGNIWYAGFNDNHIGRIAADAPYAVVTRVDKAPFIPAGQVYQDELQVTAVGAPRRLRMMASEPDLIGAEVQVTFDPAEFALAPGQTQRVQVTVAVAADGDPGVYHLVLGADAGDYLASTRLGYSVVRNRAWWRWVLFGAGPFLFVIALLVFRAQRRRPPQTAGP